MSLAFGIERIESQGAFAGTTGTGQDDKPIAGDVDIDIFQVVDPGASDPNDMIGLLGGRMSSSRSARCFAHDV